MAASLFSRSTRAAERRQRRTLQMAGLWGLLLLVVASVLSYRLLTRSFTELETADTGRRIDQARQALGTELMQLQIANRDYATWDDAAYFVGHRNRSFVNANFGAVTVEGLHVDLVWIRDRTGRTLYSGLLTEDYGRVIEPAPQELLQAFAPLFGAAAQSEADDVLGRLLATPRGLMAYSLLEITRSDRSSPTGAMMLFARRMDSRVYGRIAQTSQLPIVAQDLDAPLARPAALPGAVQQWLTAAGGAATFVHAGTASSISGYLRLPDRTGKPALLLSVQQPRDIYAVGSRTTRLLLGVSLASFLLFGMALLLLVRQLQRTRRSADQHYRNIAQHLREAIMVVDASGEKFLEANETVQRLLGYEPGELGELRTSDVFLDLAPQPSTGKKPDSAVARTVTTRARRRDGSICDLEVSITALRDGGLNLQVLVGRDVTHRRAAQEQQAENERRLIHLAQHDSLTGLPNRLFMRTHLPEMLQEVSESEGGLVLIYLDVDQFKNFNDSRGHAFGDRLLQLVARRLRSVVSEGDHVVRMGGDEFVIVLRMPAQRALVDGVARRLGAAVSEPLHAEGTELVLTASMGVAMYPDDGLDMDLLLKHADIALYLAKDAGRNCHRFFKANMEVRVSEDVALEQAMRHALGSEQFFVEYQPVVDLATNRISGLEALLRWRHPELGLVPPARFIPLAERTGMIEALGEQVLAAVLAQVRDWQAARLPRLPVAVNVSVLQLERSDFTAIVQKHLFATAVDPELLQFEITESAFLREQEQIVDCLQRLRQLGCRILIDDFGTGYSALSYLHKLPIDGLKIDRSFVVEMARSHGQSPVITGIVNMARELRLAVVVEGVETAEQLMLLRESRVPAAQGYFFSRPMSAERCGQLLGDLDKLRSSDESTTVRLLRGSDFSLAS